MMITPYLNISMKFDVKAVSSLPAFKAVLEMETSRRFVFCGKAPFWSEECRAVGTTKYHNITKD